MECLHLIVYVRLCVCVCVYRRSQYINVCDRMNVHVLHHFFCFHLQIIFSAVFFLMFFGNPWINMDICFEGGASRSQPDPSLKRDTPPSSLHTVSIMVRGKHRCLPVSSYQGLLLDTSFVSVTQIEGNIRDFTKKPFYSRK